MLKLSTSHYAVKPFKHAQKLAIRASNQPRLPAWFNCYSSSNTLQKGTTISGETHISIPEKNNNMIIPNNGPVLSTISRNFNDFNDLLIKDRSDHPKDHDDGSLDIFDLMGETKHFSVSKNDRYLSWLENDELDFPVDNDTVDPIPSSSILHPELDDDSTNLTTVIINNEKEHLERLRRIAEMTTNKRSPDSFILKSFERLITVIHLQSRIISKCRKPFNWPIRSFEPKLVSSYPKFPTTTKLIEKKFYIYLKDIISNDYGSKSELDGESYLFLNELISHRLPEFEMLISNHKMLNLIMSFYARLGDVNGCLYVVEQFEKVLGIKPDTESFNLILFSVLQVKKLNKVDKTFKKQPDSLSKFIGVTLKKLSWFYRLSVDESTFHLIYLIVDEVDIKLRILGMMVENQVSFTLRPVLSDIVTTIYRKQMTEDGINLTYNGFKDSLGESQMVPISTKSSILVFNSMIKVKLYDFHDVAGVLQLIQTHKKNVDMKTLILLVNYFIDSNELWNALSAMNYLTGRYIKIYKMSKGYRERTTKVMFENYEKWFELLDNQNFKMLMKTLFHYSFVFVNKKRVNLIGLEKIKEMIWFYENQTGKSFTLYDKLTDDDTKFRKEIMAIEWITIENIDDNLNNKSYLNKAKVLGYKAVEDH